ncbi:photosystem II reaction center protein Psb28 [Thalassoporum mexicanum PCC 7367]|uniref:photosystem II reaction center protein Psb28 n=1 Tax=Thalassoporum mexicanum TaxID=3457544 RepID=UPI00029F8E7B|nr:photosystem II reaction center protein Psb28 [Pseudanabaena sp. PCC 7367]AFY71288.1 photosystem II reaction center protein Psb28 [Pseudanabaena sp. PCC 7367]
MTARVQFIEGLDEELANISLRKRRDTEVKIVVLFFEQVRAIENIRSFTNKIDILWLRDEEGDIQVTPTGIKFKFGEDEENPKGEAECSFEVSNDEDWERVMRFLHRYADQNGFEFQ